MELLENQKDLRIKKSKIEKEFNNKEKKQKAEKMNQKNKIKNDKNIKGIENNLEN